MDLKTDRLNKADTYIVAVSGGVDSVVLLDMLVKHGYHHLIVAHFDHGIRHDSHDDAQFVEKLAQRYDLEFETRREELGEAASEEHARDRRYAFLRTLGVAYGAAIMTAHHADDVIETIAINVTRGTGWRGLAVFDSDIIRPLLDTTKYEIKEYATAHAIVWHEDSTNSSDTYLRNRIRRKMDVLLTADVRRQLLALRAQQVALKQQIDNELIVVIGEMPDHRRYFFIHLDPLTAIECLRVVTEARLTRPQLARAMMAIKTAKAGASYHAGSGVEFRFTSRNFVIKLIK